MSINNSKTRNLKSIISESLIQYNTDSGFVNNINIIGTTYKNRVSTSKKAYKKDPSRVISNRMK